MKRFIVTIAMALMLLTTGATDDYWFRTLDVKTGLSDNYVKDILRDRYGFMWMATSNGLNRYDGYQFKVYTVTQLGSNNDDIVHLAEDGEGTLWIQTLHHLYTYDRTGDRIKNDAREKLRALGIRDSVRKIYTDDGQNLWAVTRQALYRYDFKKRMLMTIARQTPAEVIGLTARGSLAFLLTANGEFYQIDMERRRLKYENHLDLSANEWHQIYLDTKGSLWFYTSHSPSDRLLCYITATSQWADTPALKALQNQLLVALTDDGKGHIWIGTENEGIYLLDTRTQKLQRLQHDKLVTSSLPSNHICCFMKDRQDVMWIGTSKRGVAYVDLAPRSFTTTRLDGKEDISSIAEDRHGNVWIGFDGDGLMRVSPDGVRTSYNKENGGLPTNLVTCLLTDHNGRLWVGTYGEGLLSYDGMSFKHYQPLQSALVYLRALAEDEYGNIWLGTINNGIVCHRQDGQTLHLTMDNSELRTNSVTSLHSDRRGHLYVGTSTGFYIYDTHGRRFLKQTQQTRLLDNTFVTSLDKDRRGLVWIGTRKGLNIYDEVHDRLYTLTARDGLSNNYVRAIVQDRKQRLWVGTDNGLNEVRTMNDKAGGYVFVCTPFYDEDGLERAAFNNDAKCLTTGGLCLMGSFGGLLRIERSEDAMDHEPIPVVFTSLTVSGRQIEAGDDTGILDSNLQQLDGITLGYDQNNFAIDVSAMIYSKQHKIHYIYRLREMDERWVTLSGNRINFNALTPGNYTLEVKATDLGGWTSESSTLKIRVRPPFWRSLTAYMLYVLIAAAGILLYVARIKRKQRETLVRQTLELELKQQQQVEADKMRFFTNISHDLKTPLSLIITPLEKLLSGQLEKHIRVELDLVWRNARLLMDEVTQLLDLRKLDVGNEELHLSHGDFIEFLRKIVEGFKYYADSRGIQMNLRINAASLEMDFDQGKMRRVVMNLLSNAFKYNTTRGTVSVVVGHEGQNMLLEIADTGIGIKDENKQRIFDRFYQEENHAELVGSGIGLHIVKEYVVMHHGAISVKDNHPKGTIFRVTIPMTSGEPTSEPLTSGSLSLADQRSTLLIVEDNRDFCMFLERSLNDHFKVLTASNGREALDVLAANSVNIVISDIMMPEMNGMELCNRIKTDVSFSHIPIILLTAKSTEDNIIAGLKDGADDYITKPFNLSILKLRIKKILEWTEGSHLAFCKTVDISPSEITVSSIDEELITKAIKVVEEHMSDSDFSVEELSSEVGLTRGHLYKKLMAITGTSPIGFIRTIRIKRGKALLDQGRTNISEVAYSVGFSPKQFAKYFKEAYGVLPSEFLKGSHHN